MILALFWLLGGFEPPNLSYQQVGRALPKVYKAWIMTVFLYVLGGALLVWAEELVDVIASDTPPAGFRVMGGMLALAGGLWMTMLKESWR